MEIFRLSLRAEADLDEITHYTLRQWGEEQTIRCLDALEVRCRNLAEDSSSGRRCDSIRPGLWRAEQGSHVIFFRRVPDGIRIVRILHQRMLPEIHNLNDEQ